MSARNDSKELELPSNQYQRYKMLQQIVEGIRVGGQSLRILEVGSGIHKNAQKFLPNDDILYLDLVLSQEVSNNPTFVQGDATDMAFANGTFDYVVALDVYEHIPADLREKFLQEIFRVSKNGFILTSPFMDFGTVEIEKRLAVYSHLVSEFSTPWLVEHLEKGLPSLDSTLSFIQNELTTNIISFSHGLPSNYEKILRMELFVSGYPQLNSYLQEIYSFYNNRMFFNDFHDRGIRTFIVAFTNQDHLIKVEDKIKQIKCPRDLAAQQEFIDIHDSFYNVFHTLLNLSGKVTVGTCRLFYDDGNGFSEERSISRNINSDEELLYFDLSTISSIKAIRFDPLEEACTIKIESIRVCYNNGMFQEPYISITNAEVIKDKYYYFSINDPQIIINIEKRIPIKNIWIKIKYYPLEIQELLYRKTDSSETIDVLLVTYNHENYIKYSIDSILMQQCKYSFRIIVCDDFSQDKTMEIIKDYANRYSDKFKILDNRTNVGITKNYQRGFSACTSQYVAILEGDDYWTSPYKLQRQIEFLNDHRECSFCFHRIALYDMTKKSFTVHQKGLSFDKVQLLDVTDLAGDNFIGNFSCCMYRRSVLMLLDSSIFNIKSYDWMLNMGIAQYGMIGFIPDVMSVYRMHDKGTWTKIARIDKMKETLVTIDIYNKYFSYRYKEVFDWHKQRLINQMGKNDIYCRLKKNIKILLPPFIVSILKKIKRR